MKICIKCARELPNTEEYFPWNSGKKKLTNRCKRCTKEYLRQYHLRNKEAHNIASKKWRLDNLDNFNQYNKEYREQNREEIRRRNKALRFVQTEEQKEKNRAGSRRWRKNHPAKVRAATRARQILRRKQAVPPWADLKKIEVFYKEARSLTEQTGIPHEVDHIIPLKGKYVSGLHVENNLQVITRDQNQSKGNRF